VAAPKADEWLSVPDVAELLGTTASRVRRLVEDRVLAGSRRDGVFRIPRVLLPGDEPLRDLPGTLTVLYDGGFSDEAALEWLLAPHEGMGMTPVEALAAGRKTEVRRLAQALAI
jgi:hypothetical protein